MSRIRVLEITSGFAIEGPLGGIERFGLELARKLDQTRFETIVCGLWEYGVAYEQSHVDSLRTAGIEAFFAAQWDDSSPYKSFFAALRGVRENIRGSVDIIHSHCQFGDGIALLLKRSLNAKVILRTVHNEREWTKRPLRRFLLSNLLYPLSFAREIGVSQKVVDNLDNRPLARILGLNAQCIHNALNISRFTEPKADIINIKRNLKVPVESPIVGTIGRLTEQKGYTYLLQAARHVLAEAPDVFFVIIGDGELATPLKQQAKRLRIDDHVIFTGPRSDIVDLLGAFDLYASSSLWEGLPTVILESMASRIPVVATRVSGNVELIQDGTTGFLVDPIDPIQLAQTILETLAMNGEDRNRITDSAFSHLVKSFSIENAASKHQILYQQMLSDQ